MKVIGIAGWKSRGKTTLIMALVSNIPELSSAPPVPPLRCPQEVARFFTGYFRLPL